METQNNVRNILLRALFELDFYNLLITNPEQAIESYGLSDDEKKVIINPSAELYRYVAPERFSINKVLGTTPQMTTTTTTNTVVAVIVVVAITVFVTAIATNKNQQAVDIEQLTPLITLIKSSEGAARFDLIRTLINELTIEH